MKKTLFGLFALCEISRVWPIEKVIDIGTGGSFPGIPLYGGLSGEKFVLVDSLNRRFEIIRYLCKKRYRKCNGDP